MKSGWNSSFNDSIDQLRRTLSIQQIHKDILYCFVPTFVLTSRRSVSATLLHRTSVQQGSAAAHPHQLHSCRTQPARLDQRRLSHHRHDAGLSAQRNLGLAEPQGQLHHPALPQWAAWGHLVRAQNEGMQQRWVWQPELPVCHHWLWWK